MGRSFVPERGFGPGREDGKLKEQIVAHGWGSVVAKPVAVPMAIVREFYANARETQNEISFVRGRQVQYTKQAINDIFHVDTLPSGAANWAESQRFETDLDKLVKELCKPGTKWTTKSSTDRKFHFPQTSLSQYAKAWYSFICASILPTSHHADIMTNKATLLYDILKMKAIDIRHVINQSMLLRYMRGSTSGGTPHASIITRLCLDVGVEWMPMRDIDHTTIQKYTIWNGVESHPRGLGFIMPEDGSESEEDEEDNEGEEDTAAPHTARAPPGRQDRDIHRLQIRMDVMHTNFQAFIAEFSRVLSDAFNQLGAQVWFPTFGTATPYPPPDTSPDQEEDGDDEDS